MNLLRFLAYPLLLTLSASTFGGEPYLGIQLGSHFFSEAQTIKALDVPGEIHRRQALDGVEGTLIGGLRLLSKPAYLLESELFISYNIDETSMSNTLTGPPFVLDLKQKLTYSFGARVLPAYRIRPNVNLFGLLGYIQTQLKSTSIDGVTEGFSGNQSINFNGIQCGLGVTIDLNSSLKLRLQDTYAFYAGRNVTTASNGLDGLPVMFRITPYANQVSLGLIKQFS